MTIESKHQFSAVVQRSQHGKGMYHFVHLPEKLSKQIYFWFPDKKAGFGSLKVKATAHAKNNAKNKKTYDWRTSIFYDKPCYLLLLRKSLCESLGCKQGDEVKLTIEIL